MPSVNSKRSGKAPRLHVPTQSQNRLSTSMALQQKSGQKSRRRIPLKRSLKNMNSRPAGALESGVSRGYLIRFSTEAGSRLPNAGQRERSGERKRLRGNLYESISLIKVSTITIDAHAKF